MAQRQNAQDIKYKEADITGIYDGKATLQALEQNFGQALTRLKLGFFSDADAIALGVDPQQAKEYAKGIRQLAEYDILKAAEQIRSLIYGRK